METQTQSRKLRVCLWIVNQLRMHKDGLTLAELNEEFLRKEDLSRGEKVSRTSFFYYKAAILDMFGILIECNLSNYRYYIDVESSQGLSDWLLDSYSVGQLVSEQADVRDRILLENTPSGMKFFSLMIESIRQQIPLLLTYQKFADTEPYECRLEPYSVKLNEGRWYVLGRKNEADHLQTFAFDRIQQLTLIEGEHYDFDLPFDPESYYRDCFGVFTSPAPEEVVIRVYGNTYNFLHTKPLHHSQREELLTTDPSLPFDQRVWQFSYYVRPSLDLKNELLRWGSGIEVIQPLHFREELKKEVEEMAARYGRCSRKI